MTKGHRYDIRKARESGVTAREVQFLEYLDTFISFYNQTMARKGAGEYYLFSKEYFLRLKENLRDSIRLYIAELKGEPIAASMILLSHKIVQYHLSGSPIAHPSLSGTKVIIDEVRRWATTNGFIWFHLGGGVGSQADSLFRFKAGFSNCRKTFEVIKWIIDPLTYNQLVNKHYNGDSRFFPAYRAPLATTISKSSEK